MAFDWSGALFGGLQAGVSDRVAQQMEQAKKDAGEFKQLVSAADTIGLMPKEIALTKSLPELRALFQAEDYKRKVGEENILNQARYMQILQQADNLNRQGRTDAANAAVLGNPAWNDGVTAPDARVMSVLQSTPGAQYADPQLLNTLLKAQPEQGVNALPQPFEVNGIKGIYSPRTGAIHTQNNPSGMSFEQRVQLMDRDSLLRERRDLVKAKRDPLNNLGPVQQDYDSQIAAIDARLNAGGEKAQTPAKPGAAPYPEGTRLRGKDGKIYIVKNGQPVLAE